MRTGKLDRSIVVQRMTETVAAAGTVSPTWATVATMRAELVTDASDETPEAFGEADRARLTFRTHYLAGLSTADRVLFDGAAHNIKRLVEIGRRRGLELTVERVT